MDLSEIHDLIHELQSPALEMDSEQLANAHKACAVLEEISTERCRGDQACQQGPCASCIHV